MYSYLLLFNPLKIKFREYHRGHKGYTEDTVFFTPCSP
jgi:hypothetical protein